MAQPGSAESKEHTNNIISQMGQHLRKATSGVLEADPKLLAEGVGAALFENEPTADAILAFVEVCGDDGKPLYIRPHT